MLLFKLKIKSFLGSGFWVFKISADVITPPLIFTAEDVGKQ